VVEPEKLTFHPIDSDPVFYDPHAQPWTPTGAPYSFLAHTFTTLSQTRSRIAIINSLTNTLRTILQRHPPSLLPALYLLSNSLSPAYVGIELGIGSSVISKAIQQVSGLSAAALKQLYTTTGDVGDAAFEAKSKVRTLVPHPPLTIQHVYDSLLKISASKGQGAAKAKERIVEKLLVAGSGEEVRFLVRTLTLNLRVGAVRTSILTALARAFVLHGPPGNSSAGGGHSGSPYASNGLLQRVQPLPTDNKKKGSEDAAREELKVLFTGAEGLIKQVYVRHPCYDDIVHALLDHDLSHLADRVPLSVGESKQFRECDWPRV
jgi:DNA ligase-1